jgi:V/A-type H+-transporting ATPase subunit D
MAKVKKTKNALKAQRDALDRFHRFLPTLELKKQQLQTEVRTVDALLREKDAEEQALVAEITPWIKLLAEDVDLASYLELKEMIIETGNIAGVNVPVYQDVVIVQNPVDLFATPPWVDDALSVLRRLIRVRMEQVVLREQRRLLAEELRITSQRVNLFEKVKIPECEENIRIINIALGDAQTAAVARAKIAKGKGQAIVSGKSGVTES